MKTKTILGSLAFVGGLITFGFSSAQNYPIKPVHIIHGYGAGVPLDAAARVLATELAKRMGQPFVVEPRPGASGSIGARAVVTAAPDGYTTLFGVALSVHPLFVKDNSVDASKELRPISNILEGSHTFIVRSDLGIKSFQDLLAYAKANPGKLNVGSGAISITLVLTVFQARTGTSLVIVPFKSGSPVTELLSGEIDLVATAPGAYLPHIKSGKLIALFSTKRTSLLPAVPTAAEVGIPNFETTVNVGFWAPFATPRTITQQLSNEAIGMVKNRDIADQLLRASGQEPIGSTPEEQMRTFEADIKLWTEAARLANYKPE